MHSSCYGRYALCAIATFGFSLRADRADEPRAKKPVPEAAALTSTLTVVRDLYKSDYDKAKTPEQRTALAKKIFTEAQAATDDAVGQYALLGVAKDIALLGNDYETALNAIDRQDQEFDLDPFPARIDVLKAAMKTAKVQKDFETLAKASLPLIDQALARDKYESSKQLTAIALGFVRQARDTEAAKRLALKSKYIEEIEAAYSQSAAAREKLKSVSTDADANLQVGRFFCLFRGDWDQGLPMLVLGTDAKLKDLAEREVKLTGDAAQKALLADAWWDYAATQSGLSTGQVQTHAAALYEQALPMLTALAKVKAEKRIAEAQANGVGGAEVRSGWTNLLTKINLARDTTHGTWTLRKDGLVSGTGETRLDIPYAHPDEYDLHFVFARLQGTSGVATMIVFNKKRMQAGLGWWDDNSAAGFEYFDRTPIKQSKYSKPFPLKNEQKYDVVVHVRKNGVAMVVDGKPLVLVMSDGSNVGALERSLQKGALGLCTYDPAIYYQLEIRPSTANLPKPQ